MPDWLINFVCAIGFMEDDYHYNIIVLLHISAYNLRPACMKEVLQ